MTLFTSPHYLIMPCAYQIMVERKKKHFAMIIESVKMRYAAKMNSSTDFDIDIMLESIFFAPKTCWSIVRSLIKCETMVSWRFLNQIKTNNRPSINKIYILLESIARFKTFHRIKMQRSYLSHQDNLLHFPLDVHLLEKTDITDML